MDFERRLKSAAWTEIEVGAVVTGAIASTMMIDDKKIFAKEYAINPAWFEGPRAGAPFKIRWFGAIKAGAACLASTYVQNPWIKLILLGMAVQGTIQQVRIITWDNKTMNYSLPGIGASDMQQVDSELKRIAENYRRNMKGPEYVGKDLGDRYESSVAGPDDDDNVGYTELGDRYESSVAGPDDDDDNVGFSFEDSDSTTVS